MSLDPSDFLLEDLVPEPSLKLTLTKGGCGDAHGFLTTTKEDLIRAGKGYVSEKDGDAQLATVRKGDWESWKRC